MTYIQSHLAHSYCQKSTLHDPNPRGESELFLGCLWRPHDRVVLLGIRQSPKGKNKLSGSIRLEENIGHKPLEPVTDMVNSTCSAATQKCSSFVQGTTPCGCASLYKHDLETQLPKKDLESSDCSHPSGVACVQAWWPACGVPAEAFSCTRPPAEAVSPMLTSPYAAS